MTCSRTASVAAPASGQRRPNLSHARRLVVGQRATDFLVRRAGRGAVASQSERRYRDIFAFVGTAILEEDFSLVVAKLRELRAQGVVDVRDLIQGRPAFLGEMCDLVRTVEVNEATLTLFGAKSKAELALARRQIMEPSTEAFGEVLSAIFEGRTELQTEAALQTVDGRLITALVSIRRPAGGDSYERILVSLTDITELSSAVATTP